MATGEHGRHTLAIVQDGPGCQFFARAVPAVCPIISLAVSMSTVASKAFRFKQIL